MARKRTIIPGVDQKLLIKDAALLLPDPARRKFLRGGASLGALAVLAGCDITDSLSAERALTKISYFNDRVQAWMFDPNKLAPTYPESMITRPFPFNAFYDIDEVPEVDASAYKLEVGGLVKGKRVWTLDELHAMPVDVVVLAQLLERGLQLRGRYLLVQRGELLGRNGAGAREERGFKQLGQRCHD